MIQELMPQLVSRLSPVRGVVFGAALESAPAPPRQDVLSQPVVLSRVPQYSLPHDTPWARFCALLTQIGLPLLSPWLRQVWRIRATTAIIMAAISPPIARKLIQSGWLLRHRAFGPVRVPVITHPYNVLDAFQLLMRVSPQSLRKEQRQLEVALFLMLRQYIKQIRAQTRMPFAFHTEAMSCILHGMQTERLLKNTTNPDELRSLIQSLYNLYYHGKHYFIFSLLAREKLPNDGKMFLMYHHTVYALARIQWDGTLAERPMLARLPSRHEVFFLFQRDSGLRRRCLNDEIYHDHVKALLEAFPH